MWSLEDRQVLTFNHLWRRAWNAVGELQGSTLACRDSMSMLIINQVPIPTRVILSTMSCLSSSRRSFINDMIIATEETALCLNWLRGLSVLWLWWIIERQHAISIRDVQCKLVASLKLSRSATANIFVIFLCQLAIFASTTRRGYETSLLWLIAAELLRTSAI